MKNNNYKIYFHTERLMREIIKKNFKDIFITFMNSTHLFTKL